jgi:four helix bundle protein
LSAVQGKASTVNEAYLKPTTNAECSFDAEMRQAARSYKELVMATTTTTNTKTPNYTKGYPAKSRGSIADLRIYQLALTLEENVFELAKDLRANQFDLANDLRRTSAGVAHHIYESHRLYAYKQKMESLHAARTEAEAAIKLLETLQTSGTGSVSSLIEDFTSLIKQSWGLIKWLKAKQTEKDQAARVQAADELVESRS